MSHKTIPVELTGDYRVVTIEIKTPAGVAPTGASGCGWMS